jgi:hypothetical protein
MPMKLLTKEITKKLPALYSQEKVDDPQVVLKFFTPWTNWTWYVTEGEQVCGHCGESDCTDPEHTGTPRDWKFFGLVDGHEAELGYFSLGELAGIRGPAGLRIERDLFWTPIPISEVRKKIDARR